MNQDIFTITFVLAAASYALYSIIRAMKPDRSSACGDCGGCVAKKEIRAGLINKSNKNGTGKRLSQF